MPPESAAPVAEGKIDDPKATSTEGSAPAEGKKDDPDAATNTAGNTADPTPVPAANEGGGGLDALNDVANLASLENLAVDENAAPPPQQVITAAIPRLDDLVVKCLAENYDIFPAFDRSACLPTHSSPRAFSLLSNTFSQDPGGVLGQRGHPSRPEPN
jgi:hypothetical protein